MYQRSESLIGLRSAGAEAVAKVVESSVQCLQKLASLNIESALDWQQDYLELALDWPAQGTPPVHKAAHGTIERLTDFNRRWHETVFHAQETINTILHGLFLSEQQRAAVNLVNLPGFGRGTTPDSTRSDSSIQNAAVMIEAVEEPVAPTRPRTRAKRLSEADVTDVKPV